jgi:hypothetical protein
MLACGTIALSDSQTPSSNLPPAQQAAGEDDRTLQASPTYMDWAEVKDNGPLPSIDFNMDMRSTSASIHCPANAMEDDVPLFVAHIRDPKSVGLGPSSKDSPLSSLGPSPSKLEVAQLFGLIMAKITPIESRLDYVTSEVEGWKPALPRVGPGSKAPNLLHRWSVLPCKPPPQLAHHPIWEWQHQQNTWYGNHLHMLMMMITFPPYPSCLKARGDF